VTWLNLDFFVEDTFFVVDTNRVLALQKNNQISRLGHPTPPLDAWKSFKSLCGSGGWWAVVVVESEFSDRIWLSFSLALAKPNNCVQHWSNLVNYWVDCRLHIYKFVFRTVLLIFIRNQTFKLAHILCFLLSLPFMCHKSRTFPEMYCLQKFLNPSL
jgi:hypothetical protein